MSKVTVIDYGTGNLLSVSRAFEKFEMEVILTDSPEQILQAEKLVLPGVGAFKNGMQGLQDRGLIDPIRAYAELGRPFLGICLGMQMMLDESDEFGSTKGLGLIPGSVQVIPKTTADGEAHKTPHIGWSPLEVSQNRSGWENTILAALPVNAEVYFVHSFTAKPTDENHRLADCYYNGRRIAASIKSGNLYGCQFHPEKSGTFGLKIIEGFCVL
jgi:imidazole glycerol-phosphate synthase subunit HisH